MSAPTSVPDAVPATPAAPLATAEWLDALTDAAREHGDVFRGRRGWFFCHPDAVRDLLVTHDRVMRKSPALRWARFTLGNGLLTNDGEPHRRQRGLIQPSLHPKRLAGYADAMTRHAEATAVAWRDGQVIDLHREMMRLTLRIVAEALFGAAVGPEADAVSHAMDLNVEMFRRMVQPWWRKLYLVPSPFTVRFFVARRRLIATLRRFIADRRASGAQRDDLLGRLLAARADDGRGEAMSERQLIDECVTLFAAGHETTANALTFTLWLLAQHPEAERALHAELDRVLPPGTSPTIAHVDALPYARAVIAESMRLYPPAWIQGRTVTERCELGGHAVERGSVAFVSQWITHRDPRWWPEPLAVRPERFLDNAPEAATRPRWAYFPFGGGSRSCVGETFAWAEAVLVLATLARRWRLRWTDPRPITLIPGITLRPGTPIRMTCCARTTVQTSIAVSVEPCDQS